MLALIIDSRSIRGEGTVDLLGVSVSPWDAESLTRALIASATGKVRGGTEQLATVHYANVHVLNTAYRNQALRQQLKRASTVYCDGSGVRLGAAILGRRLPPRLTAADWIDPFCERAAQEGVRLYMIAGARGIAERAATILKARYSQLEIAGTHHGFLDEAASARVIADANNVRADLMLVGMGTPTQELWVARYREAIRAPVVWTVGALLDFVAGAQSRAPRWMVDHQLEWLWRLGTDPRRLGSRYLIGNPAFIIRVVTQRLKQSRTA